MRVYNGKNSQLDLPLSGIQRISIPPHAVSGDIMPSNEFLSLLVSSFDYDEIALIVSGPYEISMCAGVSGSVGFVVQSLDEAIERFAKKEDKPTEKIVVEDKKEENICECEKTGFCKIIEEEKIEEPKPIVEDVVANTESTIEEEKIETEEPVKKGKGKRK